MRKATRSGKNWYLRTMGEAKMLKAPLISHRARIAVSNCGIPYSLRFMMPSQTTPIRPMISRIFAMAANTGNQSVAGIPVISLVLSRCCTFRVL